MAVQEVKVSRGGPERFVLALALLMPLGVMLVALGQLPGIGLTSAVSLVDTQPQLVAHRPVSSAPAPPPTLVAPTPTPLPTPTAIPTPTPAPPRTYTVQPGDELKNIAAEYHVSIWSIIDSNDIPNPDSLRIGQVLQIPGN